MPAVAAGIKVVADAGVDDMALVQPCAMERALVTRHGAPAARLALYGADMVEMVLLVVP